MIESHSPAPRTRGDVLKDYTMATPSWLAHCEIEEELHRRHVATLVGGAVRASPELLSVAMGRAAEIVERRPFAALSDRYFEVILNDKALTPYLLWQTLRRHHPAISQDAAARLLTEANFWLVREAILDVFGWTVPKNDEGGASEAAVPADSNSSVPQKPSAPAA